MTPVGAGPPVLGGARLRHRGLTGCDLAPRVNRMKSDPRRQHAREMLAAVRAHLELVAPAERTSPLTVRESLAFVRTLHRYGFDFFEEE